MHTLLLTIPTTTCSTACRHHINTTVPELKDFICARPKKTNNGYYGLQEQLLVRAHWGQG